MVSQLHTFYPVKYVSHIQYETNVRFSEKKNYGKLSIFVRNRHVKNKWFSLLFNFLFGREYFSSGPNMLLFTAGNIYKIIHIHFHTFIILFTPKALAWIPDSKWHVPIWLCNTNPIVSYFKRCKHQTHTSAHSHIQAPSVGCWITYEWHRCE